MASIDAEVDQAMLNLELVRTSKWIAEQFEEAYQWMSQLGIHLHPRETVGTLAFAGKGKRWVNHLTWSELMALHQAYERLNAIESRLNAREIEKHLVARTDHHEPD